MKNSLCIILLMLVWTINPLSAVDTGIRLELASRTIYDGDSFDLLLQALPSISASTPIYTNNLAAQVQANFSLDGDAEFDYEIYRLWLRYSTIFSETRIGKQHLNFGPARLLRSLQWFDHIDPDDFLERTQGVNALAIRYFLDYTHAWIWIISSENRLKGLEVYRSEKGNLEIGGRVDFPLLSGYVGVNTHYRPEVEHPAAESANEYRFGLDGRWDIEVGFWFETAASFYRDKANEDYSYLTVGFDYTIQGVTFTGEHFMVTPNSFIDTDFYKNRLRETSALAANRSLGLLDEIGTTVYYEHHTEDFSGIFYWQRTYDYLIFNLGLFSFPNGENSVYSGDGAILSIQLNI